MDFKIQVVCNTIYKGGLVLEAETPLSGVRFIEIAGQALRRSIDHVGKYRHVTLGALSAYEMKVPQAVAIDSGLFETTNTIIVSVENNLLSDFIFYGATVSNASTRRPCYPYIANEAVITSYIDELGFIGIWASLGYPEGIKRGENGYEAITDEDNDSSQKDTSCPGPGPSCNGCTVLCHRNAYEPRRIVPNPPPEKWPPDPPPKIMFARPEMPAPHPGIPFPDAITDEKTFTFGDTSIRLKPI